jgi:hypothetical protein
LYAAALLEQQLTDGSSRRRCCKGRAPTGAVDCRADDGRGGPLAKAKGGEDSRLRQPPKAARSSSAKRIASGSGRAGPSARRRGRTQWTREIDEPERARATLAKVRQEPNDIAELTITRALIALYGLGRADTLVEVEARINPMFDRLGKALGLTWTERNPSGVPVEAERNPDGLRADSLASRARDPDPVP